jgi:hypothetical protein
VKLYTFSEEAGWDIESAGHAMSSSFERFANEASGTCSFGKEFSDSACGFGLS